MALDNQLHLLSGKVDSAEDDRELISRARDVINRVTDQLPAGWDRGALSSMWPPADSDTRRDRIRDRDDRSNDGDYDDEDGYGDRWRSGRHDDRRNRNRSRQRDRRRDTHKQRRPPPEKPCRTILIKHLPSEVDEDHLRGILQIFGAPIQDVRLVKHKDSGASRGFAFVEFQFLPDAQRWMEANQGILAIGGGRATLNYSKSRGDEDWFCSQCGTHNFKRRSVCFKCSIHKNESERFSQISAVPTRILLLMGLDALTMEDKIRKELHDITAIDMNLQLVRDPLTNTSRGLCYVALASVDYASHLLEIIVNMQPPFTIDGKQVSAHYCKEQTEEDYASSWSAASLGANQEDVEAAVSEYYEEYYQQASLASAAAAAAAAAVAGASAGQYDSGYSGYTAGQYDTTALHQQNQQAELSVADKTALAQEQVQAARSMQLQQQQLAKKVLSRVRKEKTPKAAKAKRELPPPGTDGEISAQNQMIAEASQEQLAKKAAEWADGGEAEQEAVQPQLEHQTSSSSDGSHYHHAPDTSQYQYDESSGFYYDPQTGLYYDANSQYFYNAHTQQYMYWDGTQYVAVEQQNQQPGTAKTEDTEKDDKNKKDKGKMAKKVAKDMRRWAKSMNEIKNLAAKKNATESKKDSSSASADAGFAVLSKRADPEETKKTVLLALKRSQSEETVKMKLSKPSVSNIVASYGGGDNSDSDSEVEPSPVSKSTGSQDSLAQSLTDWKKLICLLCKRQFPSKEVLVKHQQFSDLHKQNLEALKQQNNQQGDASENKYRDRAQERRSRFGTDEPPAKRKF